MAFIDKQWITRRYELVFFPMVFLRSPYLCREDLGLVILYYPRSPRRDALSFATIPFNVHLEQVSMLHGLGRKFQLPVACALNAFAAVVFLFFPIIKITDQIDVCSIRCPLSEDPSASHFVQAIVVVTTGEVGETLLAILS